MTRLEKTIKVQKATENALKVAVEDLSLAQLKDLLEQARNHANEGNVELAERMLKEAVLERNRLIEDVRNDKDD